MNSNTKYMLDTNIASYIIKGDLTIKKRLLKEPMANIFISSITEAELLRGVERKPEAKSLPIKVNDFLSRINTLPFDSHAALGYSKFRTAIEKHGKALSCMDMLIASHAYAEKMVLVTNDQAFFNLNRLLYVENWMLESHH